MKGWNAWATDKGARFDVLVTLDASNVKPKVTWGTNPGMVADIDQSVPEPSTYANSEERKWVKSALEYMDLKPGTRIVDIAVDRVSRRLLLQWPA